MISSILQEDLDYTYHCLSAEERAKLRGSTVLLTGIGGFIGCYLSHFFQRHAEALAVKKVIGLDNFLLGRPRWLDALETDPRFCLLSFDVGRDDIAAVPDAAEADFVVHMASIASPVFYRRYPLETVDANVWGLRRLLDFYARRSLKGFLFFSTSEIYGDPTEDAVPTDEEYRGFVSATGPRACYDEAKRFGETLCLLYAQKYGLPIGVVRPFNNYGPGMKLGDRRAPADFARSVAEGKDIALLSDGAPTRTFCYIADAAAGYLKALLFGRYDYFNIGIEAPELSIAQLAALYRDAGRKLFGYKGDIVRQTDSDPAYLTHNPQRRCPRIDKARTLLGYAPQIAAPEGVNRFLRHIAESSEEHLQW